MRVAPVVKMDACYDRDVKVYLFLAEMVSKMTGLLNPKPSEIYRPFLFFAA